CSHTRPSSNRSMRSSVKSNGAKCSNSCSSAASSRPSGCAKGKRIVTCAGTPSAADESCASRRSRTDGSASGTATIRAVRRGMLGSVKKALLIVNPYSTQVTGRRIGEVESALRERVDVDTRFTRGPGHATELAAAAASDAVDAILVFSGDGTYNEALNGADGALPIGFLPGGGTSVLPRALGLPRDAVEAARSIADAIASDRLRRISLGSVNGRRFSFSAGLGFDGEAVRRLNELGRAPGGARPGDVAFLRMVAKMLLERRGRWEPTLE